ncbi:MAG: CvpA family protein, partial [Phenylobacterium sp.]|nr:CvpA family protein [Phenylobacterium sp.]
MIPFDIILLAILLISAGLGYLQGALKELVSLASLVLALAVAILGFRHLEPLVDSWINPDWAAPPLTFLLLFAGAYLGLRVAGAGLAGGLRQARLLNALDRALGRPERPVMGIVGGSKVS